MKSAVIGYTGFVGGNLAEQNVFDDKYNSRTISSIVGKEYDIVYSAANRSEMWRINTEPKKDLDEIKEYIRYISTAKIKKLVLISTVGVYKNPNGADEDTPIIPDDLLPYGKNRYYLENYCRDHFDTTIVRLPGLFGNGLKKNVIYDLLYGNNVDRIHKDGAYQYYDLSTIYEDIAVALRNNLKLVNFATPPVTTAELSRVAFNQEFTNIPDNTVPALWDMHTKYGALYGGGDQYICTKEQELNRIKAFVMKQTGKK